MKITYAVARQYGRCARDVAGRVSRRRPLSSSSLTSSIDSNSNSGNGGQHDDPPAAGEEIEMGMGDGDGWMKDLSRHERRVVYRYRRGPTGATARQQMELRGMGAVNQKQVVPSGVTEAPTHPSPLPSVPVPADKSSNIKNITLNISDESKNGGLLAVNCEDDRPDAEEQAIGEQQQQQQQQQPPPHMYTDEEQVASLENDSKAQSSASASASTSTSASAATPKHPDLASLEESCTSEDGRVDERRLLEKLLVGLYYRMKVLATMQRRKNGWQKASSTPLPYDVPRNGDALPGIPEALAFFKRIQSLGAYPPPAMCCLLVQLLAGEGMLEEADAQFVDMLRNGIVPSESCATMIIRLRVQRGKLAEAMDVLAMMEGSEFQLKFYRPRFRSYKPVICELLRRGDVSGVTKLWKHMQWHNILPKESFLLDLIEGTASNSNSNSSSSDDATSRETMAKLTDQVLDGVSKTLIYPSAPTVKALLEGWDAKWTDISEDGRCESCGEKLQGIGLDSADRTKMRSSIVRIAAQNGASEVQRLSWFANWFDSLEDPPTAVIDGPNAGYMGQNFPRGGFSLTQVDWLAEHLASKGERVLITMPWFYCKDDGWQPRAWKGRTCPNKRRWTPEEKKMVHKWIANDWLVVLEGLDDLYWMYATVARDDVNTVVVTNDLMRDHRTFFPATREFVRWRRSHHVSFSFAYAGDSGPLDWVGGKQPEGDRSPPEVKLRPGASWEEVQRTGGNWHLPVRISRNAEEKGGDGNRGSSGGERESSSADSEESGRAKKAGDSKGDAATAGGPAKKYLCVPMPTSQGVASSRLATHRQVQERREEKDDEDDRDEGGVTKTVRRCGEVV